MTPLDPSHDATATPNRESAIPGEVDAKVLLGTALAGGAIALVLAAVAALGARPLTAACIVVITAVIIANLWFTRYKSPTIRDVNASLGVIFSAMLTIVLISGSPTPSALAIVSTIPFVVASLGNKRSLIVWLSLNAILLMAVIYLGPQIAGYYSEPTPNPVLFHYVHVALLSVFITFIAYMLMGRRNAFLNQLTSANEQLTQKRNEASTANGQRSRFLSRLSHELRTPLNAILGFTEVMARDRKDRVTAQQLERLEYIQSSGQRLLKIVDEVMEITRDDNRSPLMVLLPVPVSAAITDAVKEAITLARERNVSISVDASAFAATEVLADRKALRRVLQELITNAIVFNRRGGTIDIRLSTENCQARIDVADNGVGIPKNSIATIFEPFGQVHRTERNKSGSGLGLTMTKAIVEQMQGAVEVSSKVGLGSTFTVTLPSYIAPDRHFSDDIATTQAPSQRAAPAPTSAAASLANARPNVLYVEDNALNQLVMQAMFSELGVANLHICSTGEEGFQRAITQRPDLLLLDIHLPDCNGNELLARIRAEPSLANMAAIAVSADAVPQHIHAAIEHGFDEYLTKPISIDALRSMLEKRLTVVQSKQK